MEISDRTFVVTGAAKGIGLAIAEALAAAGARLVLADRDSAGVASAADALRSRGIDAQGIEVDVTSSESLENLVRETLDRHGTIDALINNAGVGLGGPVESIPIADWEWIININLLGIVRGIRAVLPHMMERKSGHIVNVASSVALFHDAPHAIPYVATKAAVLGLSRSLHLYLKPHNIGVTLLCPDNTDTGFRDRARVVGLDRQAVVATLPKTGFQTAATVARALLEGLAEDRFMVALTDRAEERMLEEIPAIFASAG